MTAPVAAEPVADDSEGAVARLDESTARLERAIDAAEEARQRRATARAERQSKEGT